ncbi:hypothetical protein [Alterinioella nitratireducens]|uniref:hypothetical protein n=1 Tax=Alterinioella nitratireducens TaxID=2735915 RepID=UPI0015569A13|nr:hypothetical protein [Alterinioella nitratireducens]NPD21470.1 hypothetical protein [Alterinioella nitratireducens]
MAVHRRSCHAGAGILSWEAFSAAIFGTVFGPVVTRLLSTWFGRSLRKEQDRDDQLDQLCGILELLLDDCVAFWGVPAQEMGHDRAQLMATISARLHAINGLQNQLFFGHNTSLKAAQKEWRDLHRAATGANFDEEDRPADPARLTAILQVGWTLKRVLKSRRQALPRGWFSGG